MSEVINVESVSETKTFVMGEFKVLVSYLSSPRDFHEPFTIPWNVAINTLGNGFSKDIEQEIILLKTVCQIIAPKELRRDDLRIAYDISEEKYFGVVKLENNGDTIVLELVT